MTSTTNTPGSETKQDEYLDSGRARAQSVVDWVQERRWAISVIFLYASTMTLSAIDRYLTWDEAVFWSQSGGVDGASTDPLSLVASRELGSSFLIRVLRFVEDDIAEVRLLWATLAFFLLVIGARRLVRHIGDIGALIFLWIYGSHFLVLAWTPSFYSNVFAAGLALVAATFYLDMITDTSASSWAAVLFGTSIAATFAMRPVEAMLVAGGLGIHFLFFNWSKVKRLLGKAVLSVGVAFVLVGIPWVYDSITRFGSVAERIRAGFSQGGQAASGLRSNVVEYLGALSGDRIESLAGPPVPYWPRYIVFGIAAAATVVIVVAIIKKGLPAIRGQAGLFLILSATNAAFFLFWREAVNERYFFISMIFATALFAWALTSISSPFPKSATKWIVLSIAFAWLVAQVVSVTAYEASRDASSEQSARIAATMRTLSNDMPCQVRSRYGTPQLQVSSGCRAKLYVDWSDALAFAEEDSGGQPQFIYGPASDGHFEGLPADWVVVPAGGFRFAYWLPQYDDSTG